MMRETINQLLQWLNANPEYSWFITFAVSASESIAIIGTIIPGTITMTAIGALAGAGIIPLFPTLFWAFMGAIVGDGISYCLGRGFKRQILNSWVFRNNRTLVKKGEKFFLKYGGMGVFIGRFVGPIRALIPMVAGMMGMRPLHFLLANIASAAGWAPAYMLPGIILGALSLELPADIATHAILALILWTLFILLCLWLIRKIPLFLHEKIIGYFTRVCVDLKKSAHGRFVGKFLRHHQSVQTPQQLTLTFYCLLVLGIYLALAICVFTYGSANIGINQSVYHFFRGIYTPEGRDWMSYITLLCQKQVLFPASAIIIAWLLWKKHWHTATHAIILFLLACTSIVLSKYAIHSSRPWGVTQVPNSYSFPSGHAAFGATFYVGLALFLNHLPRSHWHKLIYGSVAVLLFAVGISRLYLGVHWFTDILGGWLLATTLLLFISISYSRIAEPVNPRWLFATILLAVGFIYACIAPVMVPRFQADFTQLAYPIHHLSHEDWWDKQDKDFLNEWRVSLFGFPSQPINLQWQGDLAELEKTLRQHGWGDAPKRDWVTALYRLADVQSDECLPLIAPLYLDKKPALVLIKFTDAKEKQLVALRIWRSNIMIEGMKEPLLVGTIGIVPKTYSWLFRHRRIENLVTIKGVFGNSSPKEKVKLITVSQPYKHRNYLQRIMLVQAT